MQKLILPVCTAYMQNCEKAICLCRKCLHWGHRGYYLGPSLDMVHTPKYVVYCALTTGNTCILISNGYLVIMNTFCQSFIKNLIICEMLLFCDNEMEIMLR